MIDVSDVQELAQKNSPRHLEHGVRGEQHSFLQQTILFQLATERQRIDDVAGGLNGGPYWCPLAPRMIDPKDTLVTISSLLGLDSGNRSEYE